MDELKTYELNCVVCDARKMREEVFAQYDRIFINAIVLLTNTRSKELFSHYSVDLNVDTVVEMESDADVNVKTENGKMEIKPGQFMEQDTILIVNGMLKIAPGSEEVLKHYLRIIVNGKLSYPQSLQPYLTGMIVNGIATVYPDNCIILKETAVPDRFFTLRAKENAQYYADKRVVLLDDALDLKKLAEKNIRFVTPEVIIAEGRAEEAIPLIQDETELTVVPGGCCFVNHNTVLDEKLAKKKWIYVNGDLRLAEKTTPFLSEIEFLQVKGNVYLQEEQKEAMEALGMEEEQLKICKGKTITNNLRVYVDAAMLSEAEKGIGLWDCVEVHIEEDVTAEQIREKLQIENCASVSCTKEQRAAVESVCRGVTHIGINDEKEPETPGNAINAESYIL